MTITERYNTARKDYNTLLRLYDACTWIGMKYGQGAIMEFTDWWFNQKEESE